MRLRQARWALPLSAAVVALSLVSGCGSAEPPVSDSEMRVTRAAVADSAVAALHFYDETHGWAVSGAHRQVKLSVTSDGASWRTTTLPIRGRATDIEFVDKLHGWVAVEAGGSGGSLAVLRTSDGGRSWRTTRIAGVSTYEGGFSFTSPREGWLVGARADDPRLPVALRTRDGGATWRRVHLADGLVTLTSVVFQEPPLCGWVSGYDNQHIGTPATGYTTADGGRTWTAIGGEDVPKSGLVKVDDTHVWSLGESGDRSRMLRWDPASGGWDAIATSGEVPTLFAFGSDDAGWGVHFDTGEEGVVTGWRLLATTDGGRTWTYTGAEIPAEPTAICCPSADEAAVATVAGSIVTVRR